MHKLRDYKMTNNSHEDAALRVMTVCEWQISQALFSFAKQELTEPVVVHQQESLDTCLDALLVEDIDVLIVQVFAPVRVIQDFLHDLRERDLTIDILLFKKTNRSTICFTTTTQPEEDTSHKASDYFINALKRQYHCYQINHQDAKWNQCFHPNNVDHNKREMLLELLSGITDGEVQSFYKQFDLCKNGHYLFVWELAKSEFVDYAFNKNIYHFINEIRREEFMSVLCSGSGGEVLVIDLYTAVILFNDYASKSAAHRLKEMQRMKNCLASVGDCKGAYQFMSEYVPDLENICKAYASYQKSRPYRFFCREVNVLTSESIASRHRWIPDEFIEETLNNIKDVIRYDIRNEKLLMLVRCVFIDIIKPSQSYTLYYTLSDSIHSMLKNEIAIHELRNALDDPDLLSSIQFSSIEEKCEEMLQFIQSLQHQFIAKSSIHNTIVLNTIVYINNNYAKDLKIPQIAEAMNVSGTHLNHLFKTEVGKGIKRYLTEIRIEKAKTLLDTTDNPVYLVASRVGFSDFRHFSKIFKSYMGYSPSRFRKRDHIQPRQ
ncbi:MAG: helix-turn-helix transcriptional regulator [Chloroflexi bacterium]|nr:helix-turn-helix transcriptional regulator [Chloroflexota bacterium]